MDVLDPEYLEQMVMESDAFTAELERELQVWRQANAEMKEQLKEVQAVHERCLRLSARIDEPPEDPPPEFWENFDVEAHISKVCGYAIDPFVNEPLFISEGI